MDGCPTPSPPSTATEKSRKMNENSRSRVEWIRVHFSRLQREDGEEVCILPTAIIFLLLLSAAAGFSSLQKEFEDQSKDQQSHTCGWMSDAFASFVAAPRALWRFREENFTAHNAIDGN